MAYNNGWDIEDKNMTQCTKKEIDFGIFILHRLSERWNRSVPETYRILQGGENAK
jgi:hypothetical protein